MINWIHKFFNPHCEHCRLEKLESLEHDKHQKEIERLQSLEDDSCKNCEILKQLLDIEKFENKQLLDRILYVAPIEHGNNQEEPIKPILPKSITSIKMRREMLEAEDRVRNQKLQEKEKEMIPAKSTMELEMELLKEKA